MKTKSKEAICCAYAGKCSDESAPSCWTCTNNTNAKRSHYTPIGYQPYINPIYPYWPYYGTGDVWHTGATTYSPDYVCEFSGSTVTMPKGPCTLTSHYSELN